MFSYITNLVKKTTNKYGENNPFALCRQMGIEVLFTKLGENLKGYFFYQSRIKIIVINEDLSDNEQKIVCAHELGHAIMHKDYALSRSFSDFELFCVSARPELEATLFAAELLIKDGDVLALLKDEQNFFNVASCLCVPTQLLAFKFKILNERGYGLNIPLTVMGNFLGKY
jgi:Zn-dependent peptidase ImmA (M78 family)